MNPSLHWLITTNCATILTSGTPSLSFRNVSNPKFSARIFRVFGNGRNGFRLAGLFGRRDRLARVNSCRREKTWTVVNDNTILVVLVLVACRVRGMNRIHCTRYWNVLPCTKSTGATKISTNFCASLLSRLVVRQKSVIVCAELFEPLSAVVLVLVFRFSIRLPVNSSRKISQVWCGPFFFCCCFIIQKTIDLASTHTNRITHFRTKHWQGHSSYKNLCEQNVRAIIGEE